MRTILVMLVAGTLLAVPLAGSAERTNADLDHVARLLAEARGIVRAPGELSEARVAELSFVVPQGSTGIVATMDWATMEIAVEPLLSALPGSEDTSGESGCGMFSPNNFGWAVSPLALGTASSGCTYSAHPGGVATQRLACLSPVAGIGSFCSIDAAHNDGSGFGFVVFECIYDLVIHETMNWVTGVQTHVAGAGFCSTIAWYFGADPPDWASYDSVIGGDPNTVILGLNNW